MSLCTAVICTRGVTRVGCKALNPRELPLAAQVEAVESWHRTDAPEPPAEAGGVRSLSQPQITQSSRILRIGAIATFVGLQNLQNLRTP